MFRFIRGFRLCSAQFRFCICRSCNHLGRSLRVFANNNCFGFLLPALPPAFAQGSCFHYFPFADCLLLNSWIRLAFPAFYLCFQHFMSYAFNTRAQFIYFSISSQAVTVNLFCFICLLLAFLVSSFQLLPSAFCFMFFTDSCCALPLSLSVLPLIWVSPFVIIRYHSFFCFSSSNIVQTN